MWRKFLLMCVAGAIVALRIDAHAAVQYSPAVSIQPAVRENGAHDRRVALVIGNSGNSGDELSIRGNPLNDAHSMSAALTAMGFEVIARTDATPVQMRQAIADFRQRLREGGVGLFYFAGHGLHVDGRTILVPAGIDTRSTAALLADGIDLATVMDAMSVPRPHRLNVMILDTCLSDPLEEPSLAGFALPTQTFVAYATRPGGFAGDGAAHGIFTRALLDTLATARERDIGAVFRRVTSMVSTGTHGEQQPWVASSLVSEFRFAALSSADAARLTLAGSDSAEVLSMHSRGILPKDSNEQYELTFWDSIKDSNYPSDYEAYLKAYPNGRFATLARARIERLQAAGAKGQASSAPTHAAPASVAPAQRPPAVAASPASAQPAPAPTATAAPRLPLRPRPHRNGSSRTRPQRARARTARRAP